MLHESEGVADTAHVFRPDVMVVLNYDPEAFAYRLVRADGCVLERIFDGRDSTWALREHGTTIKSNLREKDLIRGWYLKKQSALFHYWPDTTRAPRDYDIFKTTDCQIVASVNLREEGKGAHTPGIAVVFRAQHDLALHYSFGLNTGRDRGFGMWVPAMSIAPRSTFYDDYKQEIHSDYPYTMRITCYSNLISCALYDPKSDPPEFKMVFQAETQAEPDRAGALSLHGVNR
jgi:hypothetical protein